MANEHSQTLQAYALSPVAPGITNLLDRAVALTTGNPGNSPGPDTEVLIGGRPTRNHLEACPNLRVLIIPYAGVPEKTRELLLDFPWISVHNLHHNAAAAAELATALLLAAGKRIVPADRSLRGGDWSIRYADAGDVQFAGKTALVLGLGAIGSRVARVCASLGMHVVGVRRHPDKSHAVNGVAETHPVAALDTLLPASDAVVVALPLTPETRGLLGARELAFLPRHAILVNVARGAVVDEEALFEALARGQIGAAGIDVWYSYPRTEAACKETFPSRFPFHHLDNVVLSPHRGGGFNRPDLERLRAERLAHLLNAAARGEPIPNRVDVGAGY